MTTHLEFCRRTVEDVTYRRCVNLSNSDGFGLFLAIFGELSNQLHQFWTQHSKTNPSIPIIFSESQLFQWCSTINPWFFDHFLAKQRWFLRYGPWTLDQCFTSFDLVYILPIFGVVYKKLHFFEANYENCQFTFALFCLQDQPGPRIGNWDHHRTCFDATNLMAVLELANELLLKITFFEVSPIVLIYVKF